MITNKPNVSLIETTENETNIYPEPSPLIISTCTIISDTGDDIDVNYVSRVFPVYDISSNIFESKDGAFSNISLFSDFRRGKNGDTKKTKNHEFNNQVTISYKYWGFRSINIKIFTNGKLQMTGLKYQAEAEYVTLMIIKQLKQQKLKIYTDKQLVIDYLKSHEDNDVSSTQSNSVSNKHNNNVSDIQNNNHMTDILPHHVYYVFNYHKQDIEYYRKNNILLNKVLEIVYGSNTSYGINHLFNNSHITKIINRLEKYKNRFNEMHDKMLCQIVNKIYEIVSKKNDTRDTHVCDTNHTGTAKNYSSKNYSSKNNNYYNSEQYSGEYAKHNSEYTKVNNKLNELLLYNFDNITIDFNNDNDDENDYIKKVYQYFSNDMSHNSTNHENTSSYTYSNNRNTNFNGANTDNNTECKK